MLKRFTSWCHAWYVLWFPKVPKDVPRVTRPPRTLPMVDFPDMDDHWDRMDQRMDKLMGRAFGQVMGPTLWPTTQTVQGLEHKVLVDLTDKTTPIQIRSDFPNGGYSVNKMNVPAAQALINELQTAIRMVETAEAPVATPPTEEPPDTVH